MYAEVTLHRRVPTRFETFTYEVPHGLKISKGQLVQVPFRKQKLSGIVRRLSCEKPQYPTKSIEKGFSLILSEKQWALAEFLCDTYHCTFAQAIDLFIPEMVWQQKIPDISSKRASTTRPLVVDKIENKSRAEKIYALIDILLKWPGMKLLFERTPLPRSIFYKTFVNRAKNGQLLMLFPEVFNVTQFSQFGTAFHGQLSQKEKARVWEQVATGKIRTIVGTRSALFLPFKKLRAIVLDLEHHLSYSEKRTPKYYTLAVAEKLAQLHHAPIVFISSTPRVETWQAVAKHRLEKYEWKHGNLPTVTIIDILNERRKGVTSLFAPQVIEQTAAALAQGYQALFFLHRRGEFTALFCRDCREVFRCESCTAPMAIHRNEKLECHRCRTTREVPAQCLHCNGLHLKKLGFGTERIEKEIADIFGKARIVRIDADRAKKFSEKSTLLTEELKTADILVATQLIDKLLSLPHLRVCVIFNPEQVLNFPDFRVEERLWQLLTHLKFLVASDGVLFIQTTMPDHPLLTLFAQNRTEDFYKSQLEIREKLQLPPFTNL